MWEKHFGKKDRTWQSPALIDYFELLLKIRQQELAKIRLKLL